MSRRRKFDAIYYVYLPLLSPLMGERALRFPQEKVSYAVSFKSWLQSYISLRYFSRSTILPEIYVLCVRITYIILYINIFLTILFLFISDILAEYFSYSNIYMLNIQISTHARQNLDYKCNGKLYLILIARNPRWRS